MKPSPTHRLIWLDALRVLACLAVVAFHVAAPVVAQVPLDLAGYWWSGNLVAGLLPWGVPVFVMVSGCLLLGNVANRDAGSFYRRRAKLLPPLVAWTAVYLGLRMVGAEQLGARDAFWDLVLGEPYYHLWYLYMLPGLYLLTPHLCRFVHETPARRRWALMLLILALSTVATFMVPGLALQVRHSVFTLFLPFLGYFLLGYELRSLRLVQLRALPVALWVLATGAGIFGCALLTARGLSHWGQLAYAAFSPTVVVAAAAIFVLVRRWGERGGSRLTVRLVGVAAPSTFGIYLVHPLVIGACDSLGLQGYLPLPAIVPVTAIVVFLISWALTEVMRAIPCVRRLV